MWILNTRWRVGLEVLLRTTNSYDVRVSRIEPLLFCVYNLNPGHSRYELLEGINSTLSWSWKKWRKINLSSTAARYILLFLLFCTSNLSAIVFAILQSVINVKESFYKGKFNTIQEIIIQSPKKSIPAFFRPTVAFFSGHIFWGTRNLNVRFGSPALQGKFFFFKIRLDWSPGFPKVHFVVCKFRWSYSVTKDSVPRKQISSKSFYWEALFQRKCFLYRNRVGVSWQNKLTKLMIK